MTLRKFITGATVLTGLFALSLPLSPTFASGCSAGGGCPINKVNPCNSKCSDHNTTMDKCGCDKIIPQDKCGCEDLGAAVGAAAPVAESHYRQQKYAYPANVYNNAASTTMVGSEKNVLLGDEKLQIPKGVLLQEGCLSGAAATVDETCLDKIIPRKPCSTPCSVSVDSPTSIEMTKKYFEDYNDKGLMTGGASSMKLFYPDVPDSFWASSEINRLTDNCVLAGYPDGLFKPSKPVTRAEMATAVVKGYNLENTALSNDGDFPDVSPSHWAYETINKSATNDMVEGHANGMFEPNGKITMAQALTIVSKGLNCPMDEARANEILSRYADGDKVPSWARMSVAKAIENGALKNVKGGKYINPNKQATRAEIATMLQNIRIAGGYDTANKVAEQKIIKSFVQKEAKVQIPTLELKMDDIINAKNANVGDQFAATTVNQITIDGVCYPAGSRVNGKVAEVIRPTSKTDGALRLSFNQIIDKNGNNKTMLPKQVLTASVEKSQQVNGFSRLVEAPFTWAGSVIGNVGRTAGGMVIGAANAAENVLDGLGTGTGEVFTGKFKAAGRSYQDSAKALIVAPVDFTRTALSGVIGTFQTTGDEIAYLVDPSGKKISQINTRQKLTIAFGQ